MGKVNVCLKRSYIIVTSLIAVTSLLFLVLALLSHGYLLNYEEIEEEIEALYVLYAITSITLGFSITGLYGACKEKDWALITFAIGMILSILIMAVVEVKELAHQPQMAEELKRSLLTMLPLANASEDFLDSLQETEIYWQCCGLEGYLDWGDHIPLSCLCAEFPTNPCVPAPKNFEHMDNDAPIMIYEKVLSVVLCIVILRQLRQNEDIPAVVYSKEAKEGNYTIFTDTAEYT
ncbi:uncharacterized protein ABDE67_021192 [Symphorus nematophorus]